MDDFLLQKLRRDGPEHEEHTLEELVKKTKGLVKAKEKNTHIQLNHAPTLRSSGTKGNGEGYQNNAKHVNVKRKRRNDEPLEASSKQQVSRYIPTFGNQFKARDPRFDPLCGEFNENTFHKEYDFITEMKKEELVEIRKDLKETTDDVKKRKLKLAAMQHV